MKSARTVGLVVLALLLGVAVVVYAAGSGPYQGGYGGRIMGVYGTGWTSCSPVGLCYGAVTNWLGGTCYGPGRGCCRGRGPRWGGGRAFREPL